MHYHNSFVNLERQWMNKFDLRNLGKRQITTKTSDNEGLYVDVYIYGMRDSFHNMLIEKEFNNAYYRPAFDLIA